MAIDVFKDIAVPVIGGLGIFMLGLEFMSDGIQNLAVQRMRAILARVAGTPVKGLLSGTLITGVLQSSTAMTVMVVGLVNAGVVGLRPAISVIMGANIGTTLGNGLIALPLGPLGLIVAGIFALVYVFAKDEKMRNIALATIGFALIFYGLNLLTGGLKPLRNMPEVMSAISTLNAGTFTGLLYCVLIAAGITAMIHSSSATIGIVMGLGASGILDWQTAVAFSLGADLGTTITSWMASLNLSKNAKRAAYAHISFNIIGVLVMLPLFYPSMALLQWLMGFFGGDPGAAVVVDGKETFPLVPVAVGLYSVAFNIFNTALLFPFIGIFDRVLSRVGHSSDEDEEDFSLPRHLKPALAQQLATGVPAVQQEMQRYRDASRMFLRAARDDSFKIDEKDHNLRLDTLNREIRRFTASMLKPDMPPQQADLLGSLIEEEDFTAALVEAQHQMLRRFARTEFSEPGRLLATAIIERLEQDFDAMLGHKALNAAEMHALRETQHGAILALRQQALAAAAALSWEERGAVLAMLGTLERALDFAERIHEERQSVSRDLGAVAGGAANDPAMPVGGAGAVPA
ncbi:Na/Pi cotransporter family protein [Variovorax sp. KK3]|uniref:Na/Pi cotransporter family protein n=1 Tax=Variovorax sp. KK3 TaxID=1855728 RepID=UPI00097C1B61|nr:Na/Pi cotransporter family protein [Variovorax sp. KK3]